MEALIKEGRMQPSGLEAYEAGRENKSGIYSYEQRSVNLDERYNCLFRQDEAAWRFYETQPPFYRKVVNWWIVSAKQEGTPEAVRETEGVFGPGTASAGVHAAEAGRQRRKALTA